MERVIRTMVLGVVIAIIGSNMVYARVWEHGYGRAGKGRVSIPRVVEEWFEAWKRNDAEAMVALMIPPEGKTTVEKGCLVSLLKKCVLSSYRAKKYKPVDMGVAMRGHTYPAVSLTADRKYNKYCSDFPVFAIGDNNYVAVQVCRYKDKTWIGGFIVRTGDTKKGLKSLICVAQWAGTCQTSQAGKEKH